MPHAKKPSSSFLDNLFTTIPRTDIDDLQRLFVRPTYPPGTGSRLDSLYYRKYGVKHGVLSEVGSHLIMWLAVKEARLVWKKPLLHDLVPLRDLVNSTEFVVRLGTALGWTFPGQTKQRKRILAKFGTNLVEDVPKRLQQRRAFRKIIRAILPEVRNNLVTPKSYPEPKNTSRPTTVAPFPTLEEALESCSDEQFRTLMPPVLEFLRNNKLPELPALSPELESIGRRRGSADYEAFEQEGDLFLYKLVDTSLLDFDLGWEVEEFRVINRFLASNIFQAHLLQHLGPSHRKMMPRLSSKSSPATVLKATGDSAEVWYGALGSDEGENEDRLTAFADELLPPIINFLKNFIRSGGLETRNSSSSSEPSPIPLPSQSRVKRKFEAVESYAEPSKDYKKARFTENPNTQVTPKGKGPEKVAQARWPTIAMNSVENFK